MKIRHLLTLAAVAAPMLAMARPADPRPFTVTNPDGTTIEVRQHGDEHFAFLSDAACTKILERDVRGNLVQAVRNGRALTLSMEDVVLFAGGQEAFNSRVKAPQIAKMAELTSEGRTVYPTVGDEIHSLVVLVDFEDRRFSISDDPQAAFSKMLNEEGYSDYGGKGSARDYYMASSNGKFKPIFDVSPVVTLKAPEGQTSAADYYSRYIINGSSHTNPNSDQCWLDALDQLDKMGFDFSKYDYDNNGEIDTIYFFYAGYGSADSGYGLSQNVNTPHECVNTIWPHQFPLGNYYKRSYDGLRLGPIACSNEIKGPYNNDLTKRRLDGIGAFCHEYAHVLGLPDMYQTHYEDTNVPGNWTLMCSGSYNDDSTRPPLFSAYEQWLCNWLEYTPVEEGQAYDVKPGGEADRKAYRLPVHTQNGAWTSKSEYYVFESRKKSGWDTELPDEGLLVWHIAFNKGIWASNSVNNTKNRERILPVIARNYNGENHFAFPGRFNINYITPDQFKVYDVTLDGTFNPFVTGITYDQESGVSHFEYNVNEYPDVEIKWLNDYCNYKPNSEIFTIQWEPVAGADQYEISIWRKSGNKQIYLSYYDNRKVKDSWVTVNNTGALNMNREWHAQVRAYVNGLPTKMSEEYVFTPSKLKEGDGKPNLTAVDEIEADGFGSIYGGSGYIVAPQGAEVYNLQGMRTGASDLTPGIYIVRYNGKAQKVVVK